MPAGWLLLATTALGALPGPGFYLPGAGAPVKGDAFLGTGPLVFGNEGDASVAWTLRGLVDPGKKVEIEALLSVAVAGNADTVSVEGLSGRYQVSNGARFRMATYVSFGAVGAGGVADFWPLWGLSMESGSDNSWLDGSFPIPLFLVGVDSHNTAPAFTGMIYLSEFGGNFRVAPHQVVRVGKSLSGAALSWRYIDPAWTLECAVASAPMESTDLWTWFGKAEVGARF